MHKIFTNTLFIGRKVLFLPSCHSTNTIASELVMKGEAVNGQLVITEHQSQGRGQRGNTWEAETGKNLLFSVIVKADFLDPSEGFYLNIVTSLALTDVLNEYTYGNMAIKWPNDIYYDNKKLVGMLIENIIKSKGISYSILGIGINVNQEQFSYPNALSLKNICNQDIDREDLLSHILSRIETRFLQLKKGNLLDLKIEYLDKMYWKDEIHVFRKDDKLFNGRILGIDKVGKLRVELEEGEATFGFKEIQFVK